MGERSEMHGGWGAVGGYSTMPMRIDTKCLNKYYRNSLVFAREVHTYNLFYWLHEICITMGKADPGAFQKITQLLASVKNSNADIHDRGSITYATSEELVPLLKVINKTESNGSPQMESYYRILRIRRTGRFHGTV